MTTAEPLVLVANTRLPSRRAQALQVLQAASSFARAGAATSLLYADRAPVVELPAGSDLFEYYAVPAGARPALVPVRSLDWIERLPRALQYLPARLQEVSFGRNAAREVLERHAGARVLSREIETARALVRGGHRNVFLELHRVPGGSTRRGWLREAAAGARGIVAISGGVREDLLALGLAADAITVEHDALDPGRFAAAASRAGARAELGLGADARVVVYTGGLLEWKGVDLLVEAARELPDLTFVIAGGMEQDVAALREQAAGLTNVRLDGFQAPRRVPLYLAAADLGVVPNRSRPAISARYTSPLKVFEAMAAGLPLVVSDLPSTREILSEGEAAFCAPDDAAALASAIGSLAADGERRASIATALRARAPEHTWDARAARLLEWMERRP